MVLKLSRARRNDVGLTGDDEVSAARRNVTAADVPKIFSQYDLFHDPEGSQVSVEIPLPPLLIRQKLNAQDPLSSVYHYLTFMYVVLPLLLGIRMCFQCPHCNADAEEVDAEDSKYECAACSDYMGRNNKLMGGYAGLATASGFATEFQGEGTPHGHGFVSLANMWQHLSLIHI